MSHRFQSKVVLITGGSSGIGKAVAHRVAEEGGTAVIAARNTEAGEATVEQIRGKGGLARFIRTDVTVESEVAALVGQIVDEFGGLHGAFNNAGGMNAFGPVTDITSEGWNLDITASLTSVFLSLKHQIPAIVAAGGGSVVNNASNLGSVGIAGVAPYVAAKHGVVGITKAVALENAQNNVRVNAITTGGVDTPLFGATMGATDEGRQMVAGLHPMGRIAQPEEIAAFTAFLLSDEASFITGAALAIDGGFTAQ